MTSFTRPARRALLLGALLLGGCDGSEDAAEAVSTSDSAAAPAAEAAPAAPAWQANAPDQIRGLYLNAYAAGSRKRLGQLLAMADSTEINAFVIDVKDERGVHYRSSIEEAMQLSQKSEITLGDLKTYVDTLKAHGIYTIARVVVFKDPILSKHKPQWSIRRPDGGLWLDKAGNSWVSAWDPEVWEYNIAIAEEAARAGFDAIQFDYVRFPESYPSLPAQVHPKSKSQDKTDAIVAFLNEARPRIHALGAALQADLFGLSTVDPGDVNIGQQWERILVATDHVLPMVYPSHYFPTHLRGIRTPNKLPYETIHASVGIGMARIQKLKEAGAGDVARIVPWLQAFNAPWIDKTEYGPDMAKAQIKAVYDVGLEDWIFWSPGSKYEQIASAFEKTAETRAQELKPTEDMQHTIRLIEAQVTKSRERAVKGGLTPQAEAATTPGTGAAPGRKGTDPGGTR